MSLNTSEAAARSCDFSGRLRAAVLTWSIGLAGGQMPFAFENHELIADLNHLRNFARFERKGDALQVWIAQMAADRLN